LATGLINEAFAREEMTMSTESKLPQLLRRATFSAALLLLMGASAALADPPSYYFQGFGQFPQATIAGRTAQPTSAAQIAAVNRKADQALGTARLALRTAQQRTQAAR
jgi:hypothetical protein